MLGRHLAGLFIVSVYLIFDYAESRKLYDKKKLAIVGGIIPVIFIAGLMISPLVLYPFNEIADERAVYIPYTSLHTIIKSEITKENYPLKNLKKIWIFEKKSISLHRDSVTYCFMLLSSFSASLTQIPRGL